MTEQPAHICILGGGFGGLYTALRLSELPWEQDHKPKITLIDRNDRFLFSPLLYELITEELQTWEIAPPFTELLADTGISFCQGNVVSIDPEAQQVNLESGNQLPYNKLVIALGGKTPLDIVPGAKDYAIPFRNLSHVLCLQEKLRTLENSQAEKIRVAIVGGGYSGVELACKLADRLKEKGRLRIIDIGEDILRNSTKFNRQAAKQALQKRGVWLDVETKVESITPDTIALEYKGNVDTIPVDIVLWTVGNQVSEFIKDLPFKKNQRGLLAVQPTLQIGNHHDIFALGDVIACQDAEGQEIPATAQAAFQQSDYCAWNIWASLTERPLLPFRYKNLGEMLALGKDEATLTGLGFELAGVPAYIARRLMYLYRLPTVKHQLSVGLKWITQPVFELFS